MNSCIKTKQAVMLLEDILAEYFYHAYTIAHSIHCQIIAEKIIDRLHEIELTSSWFNLFCSKHNLHLMNAQTLQTQRNKYCHQNVVFQFHLMLKSLIHQVPELLFNADETVSTYNRKGKVVVPNDRFPLSETDLNIGHFTMICCINASGYSLKPFLILGKTTIDLSQFENVAQFASSPSGWVTSKIFLAWCIFFIHNLKTYRLIIARNLQRQKAFYAPCYLFIDRYKSRLNSESIEILYQNGVRVIVFPIHTTHVLKPFDVSLAGPLKAAIKRFGESIPKHMVKRAENLCPTARARYYVVHTLIDAWRSVCTLRNIEGGWSKCGLFPLDYQPLKDNQLIRESTPQDLMYPPAHGLRINGMEITTYQMRHQIACHFYRNPFLQIIPTPNKEELIQNLMSEGREHFLTPPPPWYYFTTPISLSIKYYD